MASLAFQRNGNGHNKLFSYACGINLHSQRYSAIQQKWNFT